MRIPVYILFSIIFIVGPSPAWAEEALPAPVHPDTLPTLIQNWSLPASLAPTVTNAYAPRMTLQGALLFVFDHHGRRIAAVNAINGKVKWHVPIKSRTDRAFAFTPLVARDRVFVATDGYLYSFDALSGRLKWRIATKGVAINGLARSKHRIYLPWIRTTGNKVQPGINIWAIDSRFARVQWNKKFPGQLGYVLGDADGVYLVSDAGTVLGLTPDRGEPKFQVRIKGQARTPPILHKGKLYITTERVKASWKGTGIYAVDIKKGKLLWSSKLSSTLVSKFLYKKQLAVVDSNGKLTHFDDKGQKASELTLRFSDEPTSLQGTAVGDRVFVFSSHQDGNGYVWLIDMKRKKVLTAANSLDMRARALLPAAKRLFMDGADGNIYSYRLDRSQRPKRLSVPPAEFARELLKRAEGAKEPVKGVAPKLAGLGKKALTAIEPALSSENPFLVSLAADAISLLRTRRSVPALLKSLNRLQALPPPAVSKYDPLLAVLNALAELRDGRAVKDLQALLKDETQSHMRRRASYVALGAISSPAALAPIWAYRAINRVTTATWDPLSFTPTFDYQVEKDVHVKPEEWSQEIRQQTSVTMQNQAGHIYTASLSPYLGGYNDIWIGKSDLAGVIINPLFTGLTVPENEPNKRLRIKKLAVDDKGQASLTIEMKRKDDWIRAKPVEFPIVQLTMDRDGDKLPDIVERRLHLAMTNKDSDGDGLKDSEDVNPLASSKVKPTTEQLLYREAFFAYFAFLKRRGIVVVDPGDGPSFELYGRRDPILSLRRSTIEKFRKNVGLHAVDYVTFGGPYPEGGGSGDALPDVEWNKRKSWARIGMDILRSGENAVAYNVTLKKVGRNWVVSKFQRVWTTN